MTKILWKIAPWGVIAYLLRDKLNLSWPDIHAAWPDMTRGQVFASLSALLSAACLANIFRIGRKPELRDRDEVALGCSGLLALAGLAPGVAWFLGAIS